jgi:hypothetical protein
VLSAVTGVPANFGIVRGVRHLLNGVGNLRELPSSGSLLYFFDPELQCYFEIPYRDRSRPPLSLWELRRNASKVEGTRHRQDG